MYIKLQLHYNLESIGAVAVVRARDVQGCITVSMTNYACAKQLKVVRMRYVLIFFVLQPHAVITDRVMLDYSKSIRLTTYLGICYYSRVIPQYLDSTGDDQTQ